MIKILKYFLDLFFHECSTINTTFESPYKAPLLIGNLTKAFYITLQKLFCGGSSKNR